jgi:6-phosphofructokinase 1
MKKIGVLTSGGDSPGMNACIRAVVRKAASRHVNVTGIMHGYEGLINGEFKELSLASVGNIIQRGGTILKSSRSEEFRTKEGRKKAYESLIEKEIEGLICIGGDGTYMGAQIFNEEFKIPVIGCPGTIDNDLWGTDYTIGYDTAVKNAVEAIDKIRDTADSHNRVFLVEVMGRDTGFIALYTGLAGGAEAILLPEVENDFERMIDRFKISKRRKKEFSIIVVAEGETEGNALIISGKMKAVFPELDIKVTVLGHVQRGGSPTPNDRILATRIGSAAVDFLIDGKSNYCVGIINNELVLTSIREAIEKRKTINGELLQLAEILSA